jgi:hypothetical protein
LTACVAVNWARGVAQAPIAPLTMKTASLLSRGDVVVARRTSQRRELIIESLASAPNCPCWFEKAHCRSEKFVMMRAQTR